jgi:hypothetical protein
MSWSIPRKQRLVLPTLKEPGAWRKRVFATADLTDDEVFDLMDLIDSLRRARDPYVRPACYGLTPFERFEVALHPDDLDTIDGRVNTDR